MSAEGRTITCTCAALRMAARRLSQAYDTALAPEGLKISQYSVLSVLRSWAGEPPTMQALAERLALDRTTLAHNLRPLERDGYIEVASDPKDARIRRVVLTERGCAKQRACQPLWRAAQKDFDAAFGEDWSHDLRQALLRIAQAPDTAARPAKPEIRNHAG